MTCEEFSNAFDVQMNSFSESSPFGHTHVIVDDRLDEYEKSVFLTRAQENIVLGYYTGKNTFQESFEETEEMRRYLITLIRDKKISPSTSSILPTPVSSNSSFFDLPEDLWFVTYESVNIASDDCWNGTDIEVIPAKQDEYHKLKKNPFRGPNQRRALRMDFSGQMAEVIPTDGYTINYYYIRYLKQLTPIVLIDLTQDNLEVHGVSKKTECELPEYLHEQILKMAVELAKAHLAKNYTTNNNNNK